MKQFRQPNNYQSEQANIRQYNSNLYDHDIDDDELGYSGNLNQNHLSNKNKGESTDQKNKNQEVPSVFDYKKHSEDLIEKAKLEVIQDVKNEIKKILENKNNFYQILSQKMNNKQMGEHEYEQYADKHTFQSDYESQKQKLGQDKNITRNHNRFSKALSEQRQRKIIDYQDDQKNNELSLPANNPHLLIQPYQNQMLNQNFDKKPIKTNTERLPGLLYQQLEKTVDYYDKQLDQERFLINYGGGSLVRGQVGVGDTLKKYDHIIRNKRYDKMMQSSEIEEMEKMSDISKDNPYNIINFSPQNPEANPKVYNQAHQNYSNNLTRNPQSYQINKMNNQNKKIFDVPQKQFKINSNNNTFQNLAKEVISLQKGEVEQKRLNNYNISVAPNINNKALIFVKKSRDLSVDQSKQRSQYNNKIDVRSLKNY
ncbi:UNKNOWN [Stylonychia lemnae]|uniref:Uncharacterized protein n=1 Tax=Stylonychia lemnae TaxID=5949 RepID=A0A078AXB5_STYLE|nr:UNKNOWN [Stylonychia lemnae]|eukprot:CDW85418.1 UNKNOWN [Stylonychia lemnae]